MLGEGHHIVQVYREIDQNKRRVFLYTITLVDTYSLSQNDTNDWRLKGVLLFVGSRGRQHTVFFIKKKEFNVKPQ